MEIQTKAIIHSVARADVSSSATTAQPELDNLITSYSIPTNPAPGYKYHARCAYHSNSPGHDTEDCGPLKHKIQDLIDNKIIDFNSTGGPYMANTMCKQQVGEALIFTSASQPQHKHNAPKDNSQRST